MQAKVAIVVVLVIVAVAAVVGVWWYPGSEESPASTPGITAPPPSAPSTQNRDSVDATGPVTRALVNAATTDPQSSETDPSGGPDAAGKAGNDIPTIDNNVYQQHVKLIAQVNLDEPFAPGVPHSTVVADAPQVTAFSLHRQRGRDQSLPKIKALGTTEYRGAAACAVAEPLRVQAVAGATVTFHSPLLGTFINGTDTITVTADKQGLAQVAFRCGRDGGRYTIHAVSPSCRGMATMEVEADIDLAASRRLAGVPAP